MDTPLPGVLLDLARSQRAAGRLQEAQDTCRLALAGRLDGAGDDRLFGTIHRLLGTVLLSLDSGAAAVQSFEEAVRLNPESPGSRYQLAVALAQEGRLADSIRAARAALELKPRHVGAHYHLAQLRTFSADDPELSALEALTRDADEFDTKELAILLFALSKAYEDVAEYERSFEYLRRGNELWRATFEYDVEPELRFMSHSAAVFGRDLLQRFSGAGSSSELPILIVGMPRSGTSLVEQILASHPAVHGGGELEHLAQLSTAVSLLNERGIAAPEGVAQLRAEDLEGLGDGYVSRLRRGSVTAARITDKQPLNFRHLGLARLIVPNAHVIHCRRDPVDTCLSCYRVLFESIRFAFDLNELGRYHRSYARLMDHWRAVLPAGAMLEVSYEDLVGDLEPQARRIVAYCGLAWDDACLSFDVTQRSVRTASFAQVRRPVYSDSVARWRRYERQLGPLLKALELEPD